MQPYHCKAKKGLTQAQPLALSASSFAQKVKDFGMVSPWREGLDKRQIDTGNENHTPVVERDGSLVVGTRRRNFPYFAGAGFVTNL